MHVRDANSRDIFKNNILASQFLKNYTGIPIFADIVPEDVEDVTGKFRAFLGIEYESDAVKKVYIRKKDGSLEKEVYVCIFRKNCASVPEERSAIPLQTEQSSAG